MNSRLSHAVSRAGLAVALAIPPAQGLRAQEVGGLPALSSVNPVAQMRSGLYFQPYRPVEPDWQITLALDYGSLAELNFRPTQPDTAYQLDAEVLRLGITVTGRLDPRHFLILGGSLGGSYGGFLDGFLGWYHGLFGIRFPERDLRPRDRFDYAVQLPGGQPARREAVPLYLGDLRLGLGHRFSGHIQSVVSLTIPTCTAPSGYGLGTVATNLITTARFPLTRRLVYEGSLGAGYTPTHGDLAPIQRSVFAMLTSGVRYRFWGPASGYANLFYHSPYYQNSGLPALDRSELTAEFGLIFRGRSGQEWRIGVTEDPWPSGPAIDLTLRLGASF